MGLFRAYETSLQALPSPSLSFLAVYFMLFVHLLSAKHTLPCFSFPCTLFQVAGLAEGVMARDGSSQAAGLHRVLGSLWSGREATGGSGPAVRSSGPARGRCTTPLAEVAAPKVTGSSITGIQSLVYGLRNPSALTVVKKADQQLLNTTSGGDGWSQLGSRVYLLSNQFSRKGVLGSIKAL